VSIYWDSFNPRPCARGDKAYDIAATFHRGFNPRPCARGDLPDYRLQRVTGVSIHAPARGATKDKNPLFDRVEFQSTPLREGRQRRTHQGHRYRCFNPRPCARGDIIRGLD